MSYNICYNVNVGGVFMAKNNFILNRIFTRNTISDLLKDNENIVYTSTVKRYINNTESLLNKNVFSEIYEFMMKYYRNEYIYKNTLLNKLLLGRHSLNTTTALTEVPVEKSKADFILINGSAIVYEIKTELDTLDRLKGQLDNYYKAFKKVCVITSDSNFERVNLILENTNVGICTLTKRNTISTKKEPISDTSKLNSNSMFKILRKKEYERIIKLHYGELPEVKQVEYYKECLRLFNNIGVESAYKYMLVELKKRNKIEISEFKNKVPYELKFLVYFSNFKNRDYLVLEEFLNNEFRG